MRLIFIYWFTSQMAAMVGLGQAGVKDHRLHLNLPSTWQWPNLCYAGSEVLKRNSNSSSDMRYSIVCKALPTEPQCCPCPRGGLSFCGFCVCNKELFTLKQYLFIHSEKARCTKQFEHEFQAAVVSQQRELKITHRYMKKTFNILSCQGNTQTTQSSTKNFKTLQLTGSNSFDEIYMNTLNASILGHSSFPESLFFCYMLIFIFVCIFTHVLFI